MKFVVKGYIVDTTEFGNDVLNLLSWFSLAAQQTNSNLIKINIRVLFWYGQY